MNLFHPDIDLLLLMRMDATPGVWGPTTSPPYAEDGKALAEGKRGEPGWGAVVSDNGRPGIDHDRYADPEYLNWEEEGADHYGGWLVGESLRHGNGPYIAALHNKLPGLTQTIRNLRAMVVSMGVSPIIVDQIIADSMKGDDPSA